MRSPKVLSLHNYYRFPGGEDRVYETEAGLLERNGHEVVRYEEHNAEISASATIKTGIEAVWSSRSVSKVQSALRLHRPDVAHFHNTFPLISPAAHYAVRSHGIPIVQTLHNYRLMCVGGTFLRDHKPCEECLTSLPWGGVAHGCYRGSRAASLAVASMVAFHRARGTWTDVVDVLIALSPFARDKFISSGIPPDQIQMKPNCVDPDPGVGCGSGGYALFVGRLVGEKGIHTLLDAWERLSGLPLRILGDGPLAGIRCVEGVAWMGLRSHEEVFRQMKRASMLIFPSTYYEVAPLTIVEAFATGLPVIAPNFGAMPDFVKHGVTGLLFRPADAEDLARQVRWALEHPEHWMAMRIAARKEYESKYTSEQNYKRLLEIYGLAAQSAQRKRRMAS